MPGGRGKIRKKNKRQDRDVSFRFHSGGNVESAAYLSEGSRDSPVFSDSLDEQEEVAEDSKHVSTLHTDNKVTSDSIDAEDQNLVRELHESAIDDTNGDATHYDRPLSDPLFEFEQEPFTHQEPEKSEAPEKGNSTKLSPTKELEYSETFEADEQPLADSEGFSDSGDFISIKEKVVSGIESKPTEVDRLLDSDDEELFMSMTKETIASVIETNDDKGTIEIDGADMRIHKQESGNDSAPMPVSPFKGNASIGDDVEDITLLAEVDTHPLIRTASAEDDLDGEIKETLQSDNHNHQLLLSEEHFSTIPGLVEPPKKDNFKAKPKRPPPPRPPLPSKIGRPNIVVSGPTDDLTSRRTECNNNNSVMVKPEPFHELALSSTEADEDSTQLEQLVEDGISSRDDSLSLSYFIIYTIVVFLYYSLNPSSYLAGFLTGFLFFFVTTAVGFIWYVDYLLSVQQKESQAVQKSLELSNQQLIDHLDDQPYFKKVSTSH